jgi:hypothetical protein
MANNERFCESGHDKIAFFGRKCPLCVVKDRVERVYAELQDVLADYFTCSSSDESLEAIPIRKALPNNVIVLPIRAHSAPPPPKGAA